MTSLREYYIQCCQNERVTPNSIFCMMLPEEPNASFTETVIDLGKNYVGDRGVVPILQCIAHIPDLKVFRASDNGLRNSSIQRMSDLLRDHPSLEEIDISHNFVSTGAGKALLSLLQFNQVIKNINIEGTRIEPELRLRIHDALKGRDD